MAATIGGGGCASNPAPAEMLRGEFGSARATLAPRLRDDPADRDYALDRLRLVIAALADGLPAPASGPVDELYDLLTRGGVNADRTIAAYVLTDSVQIWKGEPFEQAMAYAYASIQRASLGDWDNAAVAAKESLFLLKNFASTERAYGSGLSTEEVARRAQAADREGDAYFNGYQPIETNFTLGYMLAGIACLANPTREAEARDNFTRAIQFNPALRPVVDRLVARDFNTVFVVDAGWGPRKVAYGPGDALARFVPRTASEGTGLTLAVNGATGDATPWAVDVNGLAMDHLWNNMEDVRSAKNALGDALLVGAGVVALSASGKDREAAGWVALGMALGGVLLKTTARADTRYCEFLPQRVYILPATITEPDSVVTLTTPRPAWNFESPAVDPPPAGRPFQLIYVRVPEPGPGEPPRAWGLPGQGRVIVANDGYAGRVPGDDLPYILGGRCVRAPSPETLRRYQEGGNLAGLSLVELENLYREEGLFWDANDPRALAERHVLEGGKSLVTPMPGSAGYVRLFARAHRPYSPASRAVREAVREAAREARGPREGTR
ncbi:MAG: hypothetical protein HRU70_04440 [Phycisphaeraceae bacterium]|nr:MAG: hypothetical protein HRU70_04440 [Phycisphaeraceae bacterium]